MKKILIVEPYYGGSHRHFLEGLTAHIDAEFTLITLPARKWKMRMQLAAPWVATQLEQRKPEGRWFDVVLCSTFIDLPLLKILAARLDGWNLNSCFYLYFHENQFVYPARINDPGVYQFTCINFNSALAADKIAFNSLYNQKTFAAGCRKLLKAASDMKNPLLLDSILRKSSILYPGIDFTQIDKCNSDRLKQPDRYNAPVIVWNHRWEHDKNPEEFFAVLRRVKDRGVSFKLVILGENFCNIPDCFSEAEKMFADELLVFGYSEDYKEYADWLTHGDIVISTSIHEFYGISVIEAVRAGCTPLLPARLSYPELFPERYLYKEGQLEKKLIDLLLYPARRLTKKEGKKLTQAYSWLSQAASYRQWLHC